VEDESGRQDLDSSSNDVRWLTFAELADEMCPIYMSMGVPYEEYWHGDYTQLADYRKAHELRRERANHDAWLQGAYVYDALCAVSPMLHAFAKRGTKPAPYHKEPYGAKASGSGVTEAGDKHKKTDKEIQDIQALNASAKFASFMTQWNKRFDSEGGGLNESNDRPTTN
jgi:hypothetical protein